MMKRLKTMLGVIKPGDTFLARHDGGNATPSSVSEGGERHTCDIRRALARLIWANEGGMTVHGAAPAIRAQPWRRRTLARHVRIAIDCVEGQRCRHAAPRD